VCWRCLRAYSVMPTQARKWPISFSPSQKRSSSRTGVPLSQVCSEIGSIRAFHPRRRPGKETLLPPSGLCPRTSDRAKATTRIAAAVARLRCDCDGNTALLPPRSILSALRLPPSLMYPLPFPINVLCFLDWVYAPSASTGLGAWRTMRSTPSYQLWF
jgi:hypothetical protein